MYRHILIPVENTVADETMLRHIRQLAQLTGARLLLLHVADGFAARNFDQLGLQESEEIKKDREYLVALERELKGEGFEVATLLAMGEPAGQIIKVAREKGVDLIAMSTHGHRGLSDLIHGSTADKVRHEVEIPVLMLKMRKG